MSVQLIPFLMFDGNAKEAISFYEEALEAKVLFKETVGEGPLNPEASLTEEQKAQIAHSVLKIGATDIYASDLIPGQRLQRGNQVTICITTNDAEKARQYYEALLPGGRVLQELGEVYFSPAFGMLTDRFGVTFQIFTSKH
ncbi:VOC family protein [Cohnella nanjingensis]|uniref:VOC family protein n=1 Tax=Cohnella nanjingensis TaxID=1387779 RepID=A0A7X0RLA5_9BACL|nr:VOC family protein [Cohnella nanjingensis]MBB6669373.1 VOC family protein [Cohnella nanjingensis]